MEKMKRYGTPAVVLCNPKYIHNVGGIIRACSCFGIETLLWTGDRCVVDTDRRQRIPREERMKGYKDVEWQGNVEKPFDHLLMMPMRKFVPPTGAPGTVVPIAIELHPTSEPLTYFEHPENAVYVFGPEDGSIPQVMRRFCHRFVNIPAYHCLNLSAAVNVVLADRLMKRQRAGLQPILPIGEMLHEERQTPTLEEIGWDGK